MKRILFDLETDNLLYKVTTLHTIILIDLDTGRRVSCAASPAWRAEGHDTGWERHDIEYGLDLLRSAEALFGHNIIKYDLPVLKKLFGWEPAPTVKVRDTLILARLWKADLKQHDFDNVKRGRYPGRLVGAHSLEAWGYRMGVRKGDFGKNNSWETWTPEMQSYAEQDGVVNLALLRLLQQALRKGELTNEAVEQEHQLASFLAGMERNGVPFDEDKARSLHAELLGRRAQLSADLTATFGSWWESQGEKIPKRTVTTRNKEPYLVVAGAPYTAIKLVTFNPASLQHIAERLKVTYGWKPTEFTETGLAKVDEDVLKGLPYPPAKLLTEYLLIQKRLGQLAEGKESWFKHATDAVEWGGRLTGLAHIHGSVNQLGAVTHRATHSFPNLAQVPSVKVDKAGALLFGAEGGYSTDFRNLFRVPDGWRMLGADASGLELRCLAHYMARWDGGAYGDIVVNGDIHSANRDALGLEGKPGRDLAKRFIYAFLYGAGDALLGWLLDPKLTERQAKKEGAKLRAKFLAGLPALAKLIDAVKTQALTNGYLTVLDGRRIAVRHEHAALNSLLQTAGALVCKYWGVEFSRRLTERYGPQGWDGQWAALLWIHDEYQMAVRPVIAEDAAEIVVASIRHMTDHFKFRCPLTGEAKLGGTWAETH